MIRYKKRKNTVLKYYAALTMLLIGAAAVTGTAMYRKKPEHIIYRDENSPANAGTEALGETEGIPVTGEAETAWEDDGIFGDDEGIPETEETGL